MKYLPSRVQAPACPLPAKFDLACKLCQGMWWSSPHTCLGGWTDLPREIYQKDTMNAFGKWLKETGNNQPALSETDVVIQLRCRAETWIDQNAADYGPAAFSYYLHAPKTTKRFFLVINPGQHRGCAAMLGVLARFLQHHYPGVVVIVRSGEVWEDFAYLLYARHLFKDSTSTFGLWSGIASLGHVYSVPLRLHGTDKFPGTPYLGDKFHWVNNPVLYPEVAQKNNINKLHLNKVLDWLEKN